ncbi:MAG: hypothetical protein GQ531_08340 [Sulfurovum sp.]|nr:hypothetical protein [Sulfurovum sp.]
MENTMEKRNENYVFPWGFHLGSLHRGEDSIPLYTPTEDGGFCLLYDKASEPKADSLLESLCLELLATMPGASLEVDLFDFGKKKFYNLTTLQHIQLFRIAYTPEMCSDMFESLEKTIISRHSEILCCNRKTINEHNEKSKLKQKYHLVMMNLENFPTDDYEARRIMNFLESASIAGVYVIPFGYHDIEKSGNENVQAILKRFKKLRVKEGEFEITKEIFEFAELLEDHRFESLNLDKGALLQQAFNTNDLEKHMDPTLIKYETDTKVK